MQRDVLVEQIGRARPDAVLITGPTASGKSELALAIAGRFGGTVVNCDSMQVYRELRILTARPGEAECAVAPHRLYGHVPAAQAYSAAAYVADAAAELRQIRKARQIAVFVGGTGLYFRALEGGLSPMPRIDPQIRQRWRDFALRHSGRLHEELARRDPAAAARLSPGDRQRLTRALEVFEATGELILALQKRASGRNWLAGLAVERVVVDPPREILKQRIEARFDEMLAAGAIEEVAALIELGLPLALPAMRAIGVREISAYLDNRISLAEARERSIIATGQFAKRQSTWLRNQLHGEWKYINE